MIDNPSLDRHQQRLEEAIRRAMIECPGIRAVLNDLSELGYSPDVWLIMGISLIKQNGPGTEPGTELFQHHHLTPGDIDFIRSIDVKWNTDTT